MKILHVAPNAPYNDYWGYQDNLLPKYHKKLGHDVTVIVPNLTHKDGKIVETDCKDYVLNDGVRVIRLKRKKYPHRVLTGLCAKLDVWKYLIEIKPDFIFYHGLVSSTIFDVIKYKKSVNPECVIVQDNHLDYYNGQPYPCRGVKNLAIMSFYRGIVRKTIPYISRIYGVTPWRKQYAEEYFNVPSDITDVLIMGADDEKVDLENRNLKRQDIRKQYNIDSSDFLIVTGGKIDRAKNIHILMNACKGLDTVKVLVFGTPDADIMPDFNSALSDNIIYIGWVDADKVYDYFFAADLICFPGTHSVLWEQACASKVPCLFKRWEGMEHVNNGGNSDFISDVSEENIKAKILELKNTEKYKIMRAVAESDKTDIYLYSKIAEKSLEMMN